MKLIADMTGIMLLLTSIVISFRKPLIGLLLFLIFLLLYVLTRTILCKGEKCPKY